MSQPSRDPDPLRLTGEAEYVCPSCGEQIVVPLDASEGRHQEYVEDCPVCCAPNRLRVDWDSDGFPSMRVEAD